MKLKVFLFTCISLIYINAAFAQNTLSSLDELPSPKNYKAMRSSSADPTNQNRDWQVIEPGKTLTLAELQGPGRIVHIWFTIGQNEEFYGKKLVLRMYWDDEKNPSVESPINDFFSQGHGMDVDVNSMPFRVTSDGRARNCYFTMPFKKSARIEVTNEGKEQTEYFYFYIDWQKLDNLPADTRYFHAQYRQEFPCKKGSDYLILFARGEGHYVGCNLSVRQRASGWWGEGDDKFYIDGEIEPSLKGTGTEDYFCDGWGFRKMDGLYYGCPIMEGWGKLNRTTVYRFHIPDPVPFKKSLKLTIEHRGMGKTPEGHGTDFAERFDDFSSVAYWYQTEPHTVFTKMPSAEKRLYPAVAP